MTSSLDVSIPFWCLERSDWKKTSKSSSALSLTIISMLSLFECITHPSSLSLEEIKSIAIVTWIFHVFGDYLSLLSVV